MPNVLFLRAPQSPDRYESIFSAAGYKSSSVPVLETVFVNLEALTDTVRSGPQHGAVIITSSRACEAWGRVVDALESEQGLGTACIRRSCWLTFYKSRISLGHRYHFMLWVNPLQLRSRQFEKHVPIHALPRPTYGENRPARVNSLRTSFLRTWNPCRHRRGISRSSV